jgi:hypothetical protein
VHYPFTGSDIDNSTYTYPSTSEDKNLPEDPNFIQKNGNSFEFLGYWVKYPNAIPVWVLLASPFLTYFYFYVP